MSSIWLTALALIFSGAVVAICIFAYLMIHYTIKGMRERNAQENARRDGEISRLRHRVGNIELLIVNLCDEAGISSDRIKSGE